MIDYLRQLDLVDYIGSYDPRDVVVLTDSGYDNKKIETAIANKGWNFIIALGTTRSVKSETLYLTTPKSRQWCHIATFFRNHRWLKWQTIRTTTNGTKRKRMEFRTRDTIGYLRYVGQSSWCAHLVNDGSAAPMCVHFFRHVPSQLLRDQGSDGPFGCFIQSSTIWASRMSPRVDLTR